MTSTTNTKKKLIEVAIPLEAINAASAREKSIRHGHPSTLHLWWARRPLAACRAVLFAQLVDDPSGYTDTLLNDPKIRKQAEGDLVLRLKVWRDRKADAQGNMPDTPEPTLEDCAADIERKRLFRIIEELVLWENSTNEEVLERARAEIRRSCGDKLPPVYDPFSGGGSIPLAPGEETHDYLVQRLADLGHHPHIQQQAVGRDTLMQLVALGRGLTVTSEATTGAQFPGVVFRPIVGEILPFRAVWASRNDNPAFLRLLDLARLMAQVGQPSAIKAPKNAAPSPAAPSQTPDLSP